MSTITQTTSEQTPLHLQSYEKDTIAPKVSNALIHSTNHAFDLAEADGHWCGELKSNVTITAEYVFLLQALNLDLSGSGEALRHYLWSQQNEDGSWGLAPDYPGDVSTTTEAYLALKILQVPLGTFRMQKARDFVLRAGGIGAVRVFTRMFLATFGLFPWKAVPQLPAELILLPPISPINIYKFASWARSTIVPMLIISHHQPIYALPNGISKENDFLDELWCNPGQKSVPYAPSLWDLLWGHEIVALGFTVIDKILSQLDGLRSVPLLRKYSRQQCVKWILDRQEPSGDWAGIFPPMHAGIYALTLEGFKLDDTPVRLGLEALERFARQDNGGKRIQPCVSPVWDTILMSIALCDAGVSPDDGRLERAISWIKAKQLTGPEGDWRTYRPHLRAGGFSFEYFNSWYPDVDDTAAAILAFVKQDATSITSACVINSLEWILGMQNPDGGWGAFDVENDRLFLNKIPFSDMDSLCDPSSADVTGRILEAFGLVMRVGGDCQPYLDIITRARKASERAIGYLASTQETNGAWWGRWGSNYIYGTSNSLCGLIYFLHNDDRVRILVERGTDWLKSVQNGDGGWGETLLSYKYPELQGKGKSTASQTAWAVMGLLANLPHTDHAIEKGVKYLVSSQSGTKGTGVSWPEATYTGTGFPNHFYLGYSLYPHYFPMMALGRYMEKIRSSA